MKRILLFIFLFASTLCFTAPMNAQFWEEEETTEQETPAEEEEGAFGIWGEAPPDTSSSESKSSFWDVFKNEPEDSATAARRKLIKNADTKDKKDQFNSFGKDDFKSDRNNTEIKDYQGSTVLLTGHITDEEGNPIQENIYLINEYGKRKLCRANSEGVYKAIIPSGGYYNIHLRNRIVDKPIVIVNHSKEYKEIPHNFKALKLQEGSLVYSLDIFDNKKSSINTSLDTLTAILANYENVSFTIEVNSPVIETPKKSKKKKRKKNTKQKETTPKYDTALTQARIKELDSTLQKLGLKQRLYEIKPTTETQQASNNSIVIRVKETTKLQ